MKKFITERKWNQLYDQATEGFEEKKLEDGSSVYTIEGLNNYLNAAMNFPDYKIIGVHHQMSMLKDRIKGYKLRHLKIGKVKNLDKEDFRKFKIEGISWDVNWQTNLYLAVIIRDYLRFFIKNTPAIGNCVIEDREDQMFMTEKERERLNKEESKKWHELVNSVADEFDVLVKICNGDYDEIEYPEYKEIMKKAFSDLAFIFDDLTW